MSVIILDTETTGLVLPEPVDIDRQPKITEFYADKYELDSNSEYHHTDSLHLMFNPGEPLSKKIIKITGITDEMLADEPPFAFHVDELKKFFLGSTLAVGHNIDFDMNVLKYELIRIQQASRFPWPMNRFCTVQRSMHIHGHRLTLKKLHKHFFGEFPDVSHRAESDVKATAECYFELVK